MWASPFVESLFPGKCIQEFETRSRRGVFLNKGSSGANYVARFGFGDDSPASVDAVNPIIKQNTTVPVP